MPSKVGSCVSEEKTLQETDMSATDSTVTVALSLVQLPEKGN